MGPTAVRTSPPSSRPAAADLDEPRSPANAIFQVTILAALVAAGFALWLACDPRRWYSARQLTLLAVFVALACIPAINARARAWLDAIRNPSPRRRLIITGCITVAAGLYLLLLTFLERQVHFPRFHD